MLTGNRSSQRHKRAGYTFIELMVAVSILSIGIVGIYHALLAALDYQNQLSCRLYAMNLMEHKIAEMENQYFLTGNLGRSADQTVTAVLDFREVPFQFTVQTLSAPGLNGFLGAEVALSWPAQGRTFRIKRQVHLLDINMDRYREKK